MSMPPVLLVLSILKSQMKEGDVVMYQFYRFGLSTRTIKYSFPSVCLSVCVSVCVSVCLSVCGIAQNNNWSVSLKLEHIIVYENSSAELTLDTVRPRSRSLRNFEIFPFTAIQTVKSYISTLAQGRKLRKYTCSSDNTQNL